MSNAEFAEFPKMARYSREVIVTEKIDGTNAQVYITEDGDVFAGSRNRWVTPESDNFGFARWVHDNRECLLQLGPGRHYGEWWGSGIQRGYGLQKGEKRFSLFNTSRWLDDSIRPKCCYITPVLWTGMFQDLCVESLMLELALIGSSASPGFMKPEGIVVFHTAANFCFKKTFEKDNTGKWDQK